MKKQFKGFGIFILVLATVSITAFMPQQPNRDKEKEKKEQQGQKENKGKGNPKTSDNKAAKDEKVNKGQGNANRDKNDFKDNKGKSEVDMDKGKRDGNGIYTWDPITFKERKKIKNQEKVTICHKFNRAEEPAVTIRVSSNALKAHTDHGDVMGECPVVTDRRYSDIFLRRRADYYNSLQESQEQVWYSQSILDYALARLADSRLQLATYQSNNMPPAEIERKQAVVVELQQNVSLLETLIGAAAVILVNKLSN
ncbi:MAG TPA: hypothetical protein VFX58_03835 [Chitinophagaceae bacterium]|nr:hypothetical protein [Chitinophagaceae bacterium]